VALLLQQLWIYAQRSRLPCPPPRRKAEDEEDEAADVQKKPQAVPRRSSPQPPPETGFADQFVQGIAARANMICLRVRSVFGTLSTCVSRCLRKDLG